MTEPDTRTPVRGEPNIKVTVPQDGYDDHISRLYYGDAIKNGRTETMSHVDIPECFIKQIWRGKRDVVVLMTTEAIKELISDMQYQAEWMEEPAPYRNVLKRLQTQFPELDIQIPSWKGRW